MAVAPSSEAAVRLAAWLRRAAWLHVPAAVGWLAVAEWSGGLLDAVACASALAACKEMERFVNLNCVVNYFVCNLFLLLLLGTKSAALLLGQPFGVDALSDWQYKLAYPVGVYGLLVHAAGMVLGYRLFYELRRIATEEGLVGPDGAPAGGGDGGGAAAAGAADANAGAGASAAPGAAHTGFRAFQGKGYSLQ